MNMTRIIGIAAAAALGLAGTAAAAENGGSYYGGLHYFDWEVDTTEDMVPKLEASGVRALGGYRVNDYVGVEIHAAMGGTDDLGGGVEAELDQLVAAFGRVNLPIQGWVNLFGLAGVARGEVDIKSDLGGESISETSFALGMGLEVAILPDRLYLAADHVRYINDTGGGGLSGIEATANSVGLRLAFDL